MNKILIVAINKQLMKKINKIFKTFDFILIIKKKKINIILIFFFNLNEKHQKI